MIQWPENEWFACFQDMEKLDEQFKNYELEDAKSKNEMKNVNTKRKKFAAQVHTIFQWRNKNLFTVTGVKKMKWFLSLTSCHFQSRVAEGHEWLEMAPSVK